MDSPAGLLASCELLEALAFQDFTDVQIALRIGPDGVRSPELTGCVAALAAEPPNQVPVEIQDTHVVFEFRDVRDALAVDVHVGWPLQVDPHADELALGGEDLNAVVLTIEDVDPITVHPDAVWRVE